VRIFPNEASGLRLIRALAVAIHEDWIEATRYLNMDILEEHKKRVVQLPRCGLETEYIMPLFAELDARDSSSARL